MVNSTLLLETTEVAAAIRISKLVVPCMFDHTLLRTKKMQGGSGGIVEFEASLHL